MPTMWTFKQSKTSSVQHSTQRTVSYKGGILALILRNTRPRKMSNTTPGSAYPATTSTAVVSEEELSTGVNPSLDDLSEYAIAPESNEEESSNASAGNKAQDGRAPVSWKKRMIMARLFRKSPHRHQLSSHLQLATPISETGVQRSSNSSISESPNCVRSVVHRAHAEGVECIQEENGPLSLDEFMETSRPYDISLSSIDAHDTTSIASAMISVSFDNDYAQLIFKKPLPSSEVSEGSITVSEIPLGISFPHPASQNVSQRHNRGVTRKSDGDGIDILWDKINNFRLDDLYSSPASLVIDWEDDALARSFAQDGSIASTTLFKPLCRPVFCGTEEHPYDEQSFCESRSSSLTTRSSYRDSR